MARTLCKRPKKKKCTTAHCKRFGRAGKAAFNACRMEPKSKFRSCMRGVFQQEFSKR